MKLPSCSDSISREIEARAINLKARGGASGRSQAADQRRLVFRVGASGRIPHAASLAVALHQGRGRRPSAF